MTGTLHEDQYTFLIIMSLDSSYEEWELFQTKVVEKIKTHFMFNKFCFANRAFCEIMLKNIVEAGRQWMTIWRMCIAWWIPKATHTHTQTHTHTHTHTHTLIICNLYWFFTATCLLGRASVLRYTYTACLVKVTVSVLLIHEKKFCN